MMNAVSTWLVVLVWLLFSGCGSTGAQLHAETLRGIHGGLVEWGTFVAGDEENPDEGCPGLIRNAEDGPAVHATCTRAGDLQHAGVAVWIEWATATLAVTANKKFNLALALQHGAQLLDIWLEANDVLPQIPDPPDFLLTLVGRGGSQ